MEDPNLVPQNCFCGFYDRTRERRTWTQTAQKLDPVLLHGAVAAGPPQSDLLEFAIEPHWKAKDLRIVAIQPRWLHAKNRVGVRTTQSGFKISPMKVDMDFGPLETLPQL